MSWAQPAQLGPLWHSFPLTLAEGTRTEWLGPLFSRELRDGQGTWRWTPAMSYTNDPELDFTEVDLLYPLVSYDRFGAEYRLQIVQLLSFSGGQTMDEEIKRRTTLFPVYFHQQSENPELEYFALFPLFGTVKNRLFRDEARAVLFPLYGQSRKRDVVTDNYLYPIFHRRHGEGLSGWQVWPLTGFEERSVGARTNDWDEVETIPGHKKFFALWPFFFHEDLELGTDNPVRHRVLLPFYNLERSPRRDSSSYLWPLGFTYIDEREKQYREWGAPWPLIVVARGEGKTVNRFWPLFSQASNPALTSNFYLWPVYKYNRLHSPPLDRERTRILFFLYSDIRETNTETGAAFRRRDLWPLFSSRRDLQGNTRLQVLALLEPLLPHNKSIERNYSPIWSIWRQEHNVQTGASSQSLLWNLYRRESDAEATKTSALFGLVQHQSGVNGQRWRWFYVPFSRAAPAASWAAQPPDV